LSGNLLSENPQIPTKKLVAPPIKDNLTQDVALTIEEQHIRNQRASPSFFRNGQYRHPETTYILEKIREKSAILLAKRDSSYVNDSQKEQILHDYAQAWSIILPDEVCRFIMSHQENDGFEFSL